MATVTVHSSDNREKALRSLSQLPPFSAVLNKLLATLASENLSFVKVAELIEKDAVLAGNVLRVVNSALYGRRGEINSVRHAISLLGLGKLRNTAMSLSVSKMLNQLATPSCWSSKQFNLHAVTTAILSDLLAQHLEVEYPEGAFTAGLLHDIGVLLEAVAMRAEFEAIRALFTMGLYGNKEEELAAIGVDHAELSVAALERWNLPEPIQVAVRFHHDPRPGADGSRTLSQLVHAADRMACQLGMALQEWMPKVEGEPGQTLESLGLREKAPGILEEFSAEFEPIQGFYR